METINEQKLSEIQQKVVAIVSYRNLQNDQMEQNELHRPGLFYQVTIDPKMVSPSGEFIRFGNAPGDELIGWQRVSALRIEEILAQWENDTDPPQLPYSTVGGVTMQIREAMSV